MTDIQSPPTAPDAAPSPNKNVFERFAGALFAPADTFEDVARRPDVLKPLIVILIISLLSTAIVIPRLDFEAIVSQQSEVMREKNPNMTDADMERMEGFTRASAKLFGWISPLFMLAWYLIVAGVLLLGVRLMGGVGDFKQALSTTLYAWVPLLLFGIISGIVVLAHGSFDPTTAATLVKSNPAFLIDMKEQPVLFSLLSSFDVFTIWTIILLIIGFATFSKLSRGMTAGVVLTLWFVMVAIKVGFAAMQA